jgi:hypothetical protein
LNQGLSIVAGGSLIGCDGYLGKLRGENAASLDYPYNLLISPKTGAK